MLYNPISNIYSKNKSPIFFVIHGLPMGGAEKFLISLINHVQKKIENTILVILGGECTLINEVNRRVEIIYLRKKNRFDISMVSTLHNLYNKRKPEKVFCVNAYSFFMAKMAGIGIKNIHFYLSPHTTVAFSRKYDLLSRLFLSRLNNKDTVIFLCQYQMRYIRKRYLANRGKSLIIYNGVDTKYNKPKEALIKASHEIRKDMGIEQNEIVILKVARLSKEKGHIHAIEGLKLLHEIYNIKAHLVFVGDGDSEFKKDLKKTVDKNNVNAYVHFAGQQQDVRPYYVCSTIFTLASTSETFSLSALEAISFGKPCVLTEVGGAREMIQSNMNGLLARAYDPGSLARAWNHLLSRPPLDQKRIRAHAIQHFDIDTMFESYVKVFKGQPTNRLIHE